jgi:serine/threonine-protein kinase RsbT
VAVLREETLAIQSDADVVRVRQMTRELAVALGFRLVDQTKIVTAASELARNTFVHGGGGAVLLEALEDGARRGLRLTFTDKGPGIADVTRALSDGYTTGSGLGLGLGGAKRLSNEFEISSVPGQGTRVRIAAGCDGMQDPLSARSVTAVRSERRAAASWSWPPGSGSVRCRGRSWRSSSTSWGRTSSSTRVAVS